MQLQHDPKEQAGDRDGKQQSGAARGHRARDTCHICMRAHRAALSIHHEQTHTRGLFASRMGLVACCPGRSGRARKEKHISSGDEPIDEPDYELGDASSAPSQAMQLVDIAVDNTFDALDVDGNGSIDIAELKLALENLPGVQKKGLLAKMVQLFNTLDADGEGTISRDELRDGIVRSLAGKTTLPLFEQLLRQFSNVPAEAAKAASEGAKVAAVRALDVSGDGLDNGPARPKLMLRRPSTQDQETKALATAVVEATFRLLDADANGKIDVQELINVFGRPSGSDAGTSPGTASRDALLLLNELDRDRDGSLSRAELHTGLLRANQGQVPLLRVLLRVCQTNMQGSDATTVDKALRASDVAAQVHGRMEPAADERKEMMKLQLRAKRLEEELRALAQQLAERESQISLAYVEEEMRATAQATGSDADRLRAASDSRSHLLVRTAEQKAMDRETRDRESGKGNVGVLVRWAAEHKRLVGLGLGHELSETYRAYARACGDFDKVAGMVAQGDKRARLKEEKIECERKKAGLFKRYAELTTTVVQADVALRKVQNEMARTDLDAKRVELESMDSEVRRSRQELSKMEVPGEKAPHSALQPLYAMRKSVHDLDSAATELRQRLDAQTDRLKEDVEAARSLEQSQSVVTRVGNAAPSSSFTAAQTKQTAAVQALRREASKSSPNKEVVLGASKSSPSKEAVLGKKGGGVLTESKRNLPTREKSNWPPARQTTLTPARQTTLTPARQRSNWPPARQTSNLPARESKSNLPVRETSNLPARETTVTRL